MSGVRRARNGTEAKLRYFLRVVLPSLLTLLAPKPSLIAPTFHPVCIDERSYYVNVVAEAIGRQENCYRNRGCLLFVGQPRAHLGRGGYAEWASDAESFEALKRHVEKRADWTIGEIVKRYNLPNEKYTALVLAGTGLDAGIRIAEQNSCEGEK